MKKHSFGLDNTNIGSGLFVPTPSKFMMEYWFLGEGEAE